MMADAREEKQNRVYRTYQEFQLEFYGTTAEKPKDDSTEATASYGRRLARLIMNKERETQAG